jgi:hypothetical protein
MVNKIFATLFLCVLCSAIGFGQSGLLLTEVLYDIPSSPNGDPNGDGTRQVFGDEFFELYNNTNASIDLSGYVFIEREKQVVFTFPVGAILGSKKFAVVFGNAITATWGTAFPAGTLKFSNRSAVVDSGFGPVKTSTGSTKGNLASNGDRVMIVNQLVADTVAEVAWGYDNQVPPQPVKPLWSKGTYIAGAKSIKADTIQGQIRQSLHYQIGTGKWGRHKDIAKDTALCFSPGFLPDATTGVNNGLNNTTPATISLQQNYPNPFNPSTVISFTTSKEELVQLSVYNILGNKVATLLNKKIGAGQYHVSFNAANLSAGVYFYKLEAGSFSDTKRMLLLK